MQLNGPRSYVQSVIPAQEISRVIRINIVALIIATLIVPLGCNRTTSKLSAAAEQELTGEGIVRRADDVTFRYTHDLGRRNSGWEDRRASIIVTRQSILIHKNEKIGLDINPRTRRYVDVARDGSRVRISSGSGQSQESWSFVPESDAAGWATDIRAVVKASKTAVAR